MAGTLNLSTGSVLATGLNTATTRQIFKKGDATIITPGVSGYDVVQLKNPTLDTAYQTPPAESLGVDDILFRPLFYPEAL